jgi:phosphoglycerate dehydrogenase-like enzyme
MAITALILTRDQRQFHDTLSQMKLPELTLYAPEDEDEIQSVLPTAEIIFANPNLIKHHLNNATSLRWLQSTFAGVDALLSDSLRRDYLLTNVKDTYGAVMAEYVLGYILHYEKQIAANIDAQRNHHWRQQPYTTLDTITLGVLGTGSIGQHIAKVASFLGIKTVGVNTTGAAAPYFDTTFSTAQIEEAVSCADYLVSVLPNTPHTREIVNRRIFERMKRSAVFLSLGRGENVSEADLLEALETGQIKGAVLDVFQQEPLPPKSPLWECPNLLITPHVSGYIVSERIFQIFAENYGRYRAGEELLYRIDFERGY